MQARLCGFRGFGCEMVGLGYWALGVEGPPCPKHLQKMKRGGGVAFDSGVNPKPRAFHRPVQPAALPGRLLGRPLVCQLSVQTPTTMGVRV